MADCCLTRLCDVCGTYIHGGNYHCPNCDICICFGCGMKMMNKENYPPKCPICGDKLLD